MLAKYRSIIFSSALLLALSTAMPAQRYTGHDHAVFHRPAPPPAASKRQAAPPQNGAKAPVKNAPATQSPRSSSSPQTGPKDLPNEYAAAESRPQF
jgi:hypothetical protein